ncbi:uncharacterized protein JCM6883_003992 [Sporobolomyces salmoneus]|uniref:uncharacterized protein n=1 Tax=Sporobolomyces salmoneus TaxID=183962 RepID=UPI00317A7095
MEGIAVTDLSGRKILSTHFPSSLRSNLAIEAAVSSSTPVTWLPGSWTTQHKSRTTESEGEEEDEEGDEPHHHQHRESASRGGGKDGVAVCQVVRGKVRYIAPVRTDIDPLIPLTFLTELHEVLQSYIGGTVSEASLKDNFDVVLALLQEMLSNGRPQLTQTPQLRELVDPPSALLAKVALNAANVAGLAVPTQSNANALLVSPLPWRRQGIKYNSNEIYLDLTETLSFTLSPSGKPLSSSIYGSLECRSKLSGMPDLTLSFTDPTVLEESPAFHSCVRYSKWLKDKLVSFVPPDGTFKLLTFLHTPPKTSPALSLALLPFSLTSSLTLGSSGGSISLTLTSRAPPSRPLTTLVIRIPLASGANGVTAQCSGGAFKRDDQWRSMGGGAGRWEVIETHEEGGNGRKQELVWKIEELCSTDRPAVLTGQYYAGEKSRKPPFFTMTFDSPSTGFSGLSINSLRLGGGESYSLYKGVKMKGRGEIEVRT